MTSAGYGGFLSRKEFKKLFGQKDLNTILEELLTPLEKVYEKLSDKLFKLKDTSKKYKKYEAQLASIPDDPLYIFKLKDDKKYFIGYMSTIGGGFPYVYKKANDLQEYKVLTNLGISPKDYVFFAADEDSVESSNLSFTAIRDEREENEDEESEDDLEESKDDKEQKFANTFWVNVEKGDLKEMKKEMKKEVKTMIEKGKNIVWGDFISNKQEPGYRNDGLYIWNGKKVLELSDSPDEYGTLPQEFKVDADHPPTYWHDYYGNVKNSKKRRFISHNNYIHYDHTPFRETLLEHLKKGTKFNGHAYTYLKDGNQKIYIVFVNISEKAARKFLKKKKINFKCGSEEDEDIDQRNDYVLFVDSETPQ